MTHYPPTPTYRTDRNGLGTAGFVLGILAVLSTLTLLLIPLGWVLAGIGLILAIVGLDRVSKGFASNKGIALAGVILSAGSIALSFLLVFGFAVSVGGSSAKTTAPGTSAPRQAAVEPVKTLGPQTSFGDGTWVVGEDIEPGTYRSTGAEPGMFEFCSVSTHTGDAGDGNVIAWDTANANEPVRIKVSGKVKSVKSSGCATFTKQ